jgi:hypothetical protein
MITLTDLPPELLFDILDRTPLLSWPSLGLTCKYLASVVADHVSRCFNNKGLRVPGIKRWVALVTDFVVHHNPANGLGILRTLSLTPKQLTRLFPFCDGSQAGHIHLIRLFMAMIQPNIHGRAYHSWWITLAFQGALLRNHTDTVCYLWPEVPVYEWKKFRMLIGCYNPGLYDMADQLKLDILTMDPHHELHEGRLSILLELIRQLGCLHIPCSIELCKKALIVCAVQDLSSSCMYRFHDILESLLLPNKSVYTAFIEKELLPLAVDKPKVANALYRWYL